VGDGSTPYSGVASGKGSGLHKNKAKKPKPVGYLSDKHTPGFDAKLKGKSWWTERHMRKNDAAAQNKKRSNYGSNRQVGLFADKERSAKSGRTPTAGASKGGAGSSRRTGYVQGKPLFQIRGNNDATRRAAFAKIVKAHPEGINFKALRNWDNEDKAYNANPNLRRGRNANPERFRGIDFAGLKKMTDAKKKSSSSSSGGGGRRVS